MLHIGGCGSTGLIGDQGRRSSPYCDRGKQLESWQELVPLEASAQKWHVTITSICLVKVCHVAKPKVNEEATYTAPVVGTVSQSQGLGSPNKTPDFQLNLSFS